MQFNLKEAVSVLFNKSVNQFGNAYPNLGAALPLVFGKSFSFDLQGNSAYNNKIFYAAQNIIVRKFLEAPIMFSRRKVSAAKFNKFYSKAISNEDRTILKALALEELEDHPLNKLFDSPNEYQSGLEMMEDFWYNYGLGDGFLWFEVLGDELSRSKVPVAIHSLQRDRVTPIASNDRNNPIAYYLYTTALGEQIKINPNHILHHKHWNPNLGDLKGLGVDVIALSDISLNNANNMAQGAAFVNGGRGTLFSSDSVIDSDGNVIEKYDAKQMQTLRETMQRDMQGAANNRRMYFANGLVNATPYGDTFAEMELIGAEDNNWKNIFAICGLSVALTPNTDGNTESNVEAGYKSLVTNLAIPELRKFDQKNTKICQYFFPNDNIVSSHDLTEFTELAPDLVKLKETYGTPPITIDTHLITFGHDPIGGEMGKAILVPSGMINLADLLNNEFDSVPDAKEL